MNDKDGVRYHTLLDLFRAVPAAVRRKFSDDAAGVIGVVLQHTGQDIVPALVVTIGALAKLLAAANMPADQAVELLNHLCGGAPVEASLAVRTVPPTARADRTVPPTPLRTTVEISDGASVCGQHRAAPAPVLGRAPRVNLWSPSWSRGRSAQGRES